ncbi:hypothetical protein MUK42_11352 [Musa troglodytarum]|uniref:Uncharacterized protein n=1 Tax=Musa troglodytarum TaxID=320322 RepID=A0A9E7KFR6_9LILI|nr:hypothetical protein MUK42_11352 [Musa troglodytarum]
METCLSCIACCCSKLGFTQSTDAYKKLQMKPTTTQPWACDDHRIGQLVATLAAVSDCHRIHAERDKTYRRAPDAATMDADATRRQSLAYPGKPRRCMMALAAAEAERTRARTKA